MVFMVVESMWFVDGFSLLTVSVAVQEAAVYKVYGIKCALPRGSKPVLSMPFSPAAMQI
jgi:hypothetical protein